jgi:hypothetical protein
MVAAVAEICISVAPELVALVVAVMVGLLLEQQALLEQ